MDPDQLIHRYLLGDLSEAETEQLERLLIDSPEARRRFAAAAAIDSGLRDLALERGGLTPERAGEPTNLSAGPPPSDADAPGPVSLPSVPTQPASVESAANKPSSTNPAPGLPSTQSSVRSAFGPWASWSSLGWWAAVAASVLLVMARLSGPAGRPVVATLVSSEDAAWESALPTTPGSELAADVLKLRTGVATLRFRSGAEVLLEAPAEIELLSPMRGKLIGGAAVVDVPDRAIGFVLETPDGYAVDYGTRFAVRVDPQAGRSAFELVEGEIAVHHGETGDEVRLVDQGEVATIADREIVLGKEALPSPEADSSARRVLRIGTGGRSDSVLPNNKRWKYINREILSVKRTEAGRWDYRSFFAFDLSGVDLASVREARLRLNLVPSVRGFASRLPEVNEFGVYGLTNEAKRGWRIGERWEQSPAPEDGVRLGGFAVPRSAQRGAFGFSNPQLLEFLRARAGGPVTLILIRETTQIEGVGPGLTHAFASDAHPESVGPLLELTIDD